MTPQQFFLELRRSPNKELRKLHLTILRMNPAHGGGWVAQSFIKDVGGVMGRGDKISDAILALYDHLHQHASRHTHVGKDGVATPYDYRGMPKRKQVVTGRPFEGIRVHLSQMV